MEKRKQRSRETSASLIDAEKSHHNVPIEMLWKEMENMDINLILFKANIKIFEKNAKRITIGSKLTEVFQNYERS
jgi:hypothetical protein